MLFALWVVEDGMFLRVSLTRWVITANLGVYIKEVNQPAGVVSITGGGVCSERHVMGGLETTLFLQS